jgi:hypothetical protein
MKKVLNEAKCQTDINYILMMCITNEELRHKMKQEDIVKFIKSQRLRWAAHVIRMEKTRTARKITEWTPYKARPAGRPRLRLMDQVDESKEDEDHWFESESRR